MNNFDDNNYSGEQLAVDESCFIRTHYTDDLDDHRNPDALHLIKMWLLIVAMLLLSAVGCATWSSDPVAFGNIRVSPYVLTYEQQQRKRSKQFMRRFRSASDYIMKGLNQ